MLFAGINAFSNVLEGDDDSHGNQQRNSGVETVVMCR